MNSPRLADVYKRKDSARVLFQLLSERDPKVNISHRQMPTMAQHKKFIASRPYKSWDLIIAGSQAVGAVYLSKQNEIGLFIFKKFRSMGFGRKALGLLMKKHRKETRFLANVNPMNKKSMKFFEKLGFLHIQNTYELRDRG